MSEKKYRELKTFCPLPWMHLSLHPNGKTRLCCNASHSLRDVLDEKGKAVFITQIKDMKRFLNLPFYKDIRKQMLNNQKPEVCSTCYSLEKHGGSSVRQQFKSQWRNAFSEMLNSVEQDGALKDISVRYLDLPLGNLCNLKCRMCHPSSSIQMKKDFDNWKIQYDKSVDKYGDWIKDPHLYSQLAPVLKTSREIFFTGGEPLLIKEHEKILEQAIQLNTAKNIKIKYNSNLTKLSSKLMGLWKEFREVEFNCSIDGTEEVNDYIRFPSKWSVIEQALETLDDFSEEQPHIKVYIHSTFQVLNLFNIPKLLNWTAQAKWRNVHRVPHFIWLHEPKFFRPSVLPDRLKNEALDEIEKTLDKTSPFFMSYNEGHKHWSEQYLAVLQGYVKQARETPQESAHFKDFIHYTHKMDSFRKQNITKVIPELQEIFICNNA